MSAKRDTRRIEVARPGWFVRSYFTAFGVAALIVFFVGGLWYSALFGKLWVRLHGYSEEKVKQMQAAMSPPLCRASLALKRFPSLSPTTSPVVIAGSIRLGAPTAAMHTRVGFGGLRTDSAIVEL